MEWILRWTLGFKTVFAVYFSWLCFPLQLLSWRNVFSVYCLAKPLWRIIRGIFGDRRTHGIVLVLVKVSLGHFLRVMWDEWSFYNMIAELFRFHYQDKSDADHSGSATLWSWSPFSPAFLSALDRHSTVHHFGFHDRNSRHSRETFTGRGDPYILCSVLKIFLPALIWLKKAFGESNEYWCSNQRFWLSWYEMLTFSETRLWKRFVWCNFEVKFYLVRL